MRSQAKKDRDELEAKLQQQTGEMAELRAMLGEAVAIAKEQRGEIDELKRQIASGAAPAPPHSSHTRVVAAGKRARAPAGASQRARCAMRMHSGALGRAERYARGS